MQYAYLGSNLISLLIWFTLFGLRKDLRHMMLAMSVCALPLAFFDLLYVPVYWKPMVLFHLPIGIEGFVYSFSLGGIASVLYAELTKRTPRHVRSWRISHKQAVWVPVVTFAVFVVAYAWGVPNPQIAAYIAIAAGVALTIFLRRDLAWGTIYGALSFGLVYFACLKIWTILFPGVHDWFTFQGLPKLFVWGVPGWEVVFGFFFGALWGSLYELLFGYRLIPLKNNHFKRNASH